MILFGEFNAVSYSGFEIVTLLNIKPNFFMGFNTPSVFVEWLRIVSVEIVSSIFDVAWIVHRDNFV